MNREQSLLSILYSLLTKIKTLIPKWDERQPAVPPKFLHLPCLQALTSTALRRYSCPTNEEQLRLAYS